MSGFNMLYDGNEYGVFKGSGLWLQAPEKWPLVEHILYERDVICVSSKPGIGKSVLLLQLLCCMTSGTPFLGLYKVARPLNVLYIQTEGDRAETLDRLDMIRKHIPLDNARWAHINVPGMSINVKSEFDMLVESIIDLGMDFDVVMVDPLYTTVKGDMSNNAVATDWIRNIRILKSYLNCAFIISNHEGKDAYNEGQVIDKGNATLFGSTFWAAFFNHNYKLKVHDGHHLLEIGKNRSGQAMDRIAMQMLTDDTLLYVPYEPDLTQNELKVVTMLRSGVVATARSVVESTGVSRATVFRILRKLEDKGQIEVVCDIKQTKYKWLVAGVEKSLTN